MTASFMSADPVKVFKLKRPCADCPWRKDVYRYLSPGRYKELAHDVILQGRSFHCHKTVDYSEEEGLVTETSKMCAGAMILARKAGFDLQAIQLAERLGLCPPVQLDMSAPIYDSVSGFVTGIELSGSADQLFASRLRHEHAQKLREKS